MVVTLADALRPLTLDEMVTSLRARRVAMPDQATKFVSDALRWELRCGRVRRVRRGVYEFAGAPPSTMRWIRKRVDLLCSLLARADQASPGRPGEASSGRQPISTRRS